MMEVFQFDHWSLVEDHIFQTADEIIAFDIREFLLDESIQLSHVDRVHRKGTDRFAAHRLAIDFHGEFFCIDELQLNSMFSAVVDRRGIVQIDSRSLLVDVVKGQEKMFVLNAQREIVFVGSIG